MTDQPARPEVDDPRVLALAKARQQLAYENPFNVVCPPWGDLTEQEQHLSLLDARSYLHAALRAGLVPAPAVSSPPPDQTAVEGIADTVTPFLANFSDEETARINAREVAAAVLAVLPPPADRAAVLHEAADAVQSHPGPHRDELQPDAPGFWWDTRDRDAAADLLRRLAGETPAATEADRCPHGCNTSTCPCLACEDDEPAPPREPHPTEADLRHAQAVLARFEGRDTVEPSAGVRQDGAQTEADRIVAYSSVGSLFCTKCCTGDPDSRSTPVTSEDLPDGGLCDECGVDVLIPQEPSS